MNRNTIGENPLDAFIPDQKAELALKPSRRERGLLVTKTHEGPARPPNVAKERLTIHITTATIERTKNAVFWTPGLTLAELAEGALIKAVDTIEKKRGEPFPQRKGDLKGGRPMR